MNLNINKKYFLAAVSCIAVALLAYGLAQAVKWHDRHVLHGQSPIVLYFRAPVFTTLRTLVVNTTVIEANADNTPLTPDQQYLCNIFGKDCKLALAIQHAENGTGQCDRINWSNKDQSLDIGFMQINTLWVDKNLVKPADLFDCRKNIDFAYKIYQRHNNSFTAWTTYNNGLYKKYLY